MRPTPRSSPAHCDSGYACEKVGLESGSTAAWLLAAFFLFGAAVNLKMPESTRQNYARWGYPDWFHYVTAAFEFAVAILLLFPTGRSFGALLGMGVMAAAAGTTLFHREYKHAVLPLLILILLGILWWVAVWGS